VGAAVISAAGAGAAAASWPVGLAALAENSGNGGSGGFGGGAGGGFYGGGGGGGYSGGGGGGNNGGGGGGSIIDSSAAAILYELSGVASPNGSHNGEIIITVVPEPSTLALLAVGAAGFLARRRDFSQKLSPKSSPNER